MQCYVVKLKLDKPNFSENSYEKILKLCGIIDNTENNIYPTLAGTLIFGKYPQSFYPQLFIACVVVPGTTLGDVGIFGERFIDNKRVEGTIEEMLEGALHFLKKNMKTKVIINKNGERINRTEYPLDALREAIANALIHRDYSGKTEGAYISVYMYQDRIEITSPGGLYGVNKLEKLDSDRIMETRNPNIVRILEEKGNVIENRHTGISTMKREMKKYGLSEPEFYEESGFFKVIFRNDLFFDTKNNVQFESGHKSDTESDTQSDTQNLDGKLINKVLEYCKEAKTAKEIREYLGISSKRYVAYSILKPMVKAGMLEFTNKENKNARNQKYVTKNN